MQEPDFRIGKRVRLNERGRKRWKLSPARTGVVVGFAKKSATQCQIQWDGLKLPQVIHRSYLEPDDCPGTASA